MHKVVFVKSRVLNSFNLKIFCTNYSMVYRSNYKTIKLYSCTIKEYKKTIIMHIKYDYKYENKYGL